MHSDLGFFAGVAEDSSWWHEVGANITERFSSPEFVEAFCQQDPAELRRHALLQMEAAADSVVEQAAESDDEDMWKYECDYMME